MLPRVNLLRTDTTDYLMFSTNESITQTIYNTGHWAKLILDISVAFLNDVEAPFVIDIGANLGAYAVPLAQTIAAAKGTVYAYEPQRIVFYQLCGNAFLNRLDNLHLFQLAFGSSPRLLELSNIDYSASINVGSFTLNETALTQGYASPPADGVYTVPLQILDDVAFPRPPSLIKIDVEGLELDVLKGGRALLGRSGYPPLLLEAWTTEWFVSERGALLSFLQELGYRVFLLGDEIIAQHPDHPRQFDFGVNDQGLLTMLRSR